MLKTKLKKEDQVIVVTGSDKGKRGKILHIFKDGRVIVEGINKKIKNIKAEADKENSKGGPVELEYPINVSNVMFFDDKQKKGIRVNKVSRENTKSTKKVKSTKK
jgi:large subunit ribosomal protein L24